MSPEEIQYCIECGGEENDCNCFIYEINKDWEIIK